MAKEIEIRVWCDTEHAVRRPGDTTVPIAVNGQPPRTVDLCAACSAALLDPLVALLEKHGAPVEPAQPAPTGARKGRTPEGGRPVQCLWCPATFTASSVGGFNRHLRVEHGLPTTSDLFTVCPICGKDGLSTMGRHLANQHPEYDFTGVTAAYLYARGQGDPHNGYARAIVQAERQEGAP